jgi:competence protein ComEC
MTEKISLTEGMRMKKFLVVLVATIVLATVFVAGCTGGVKNTTSPSPATSTLPSTPVLGRISPSASNLTMTAIDVGQGDSLLITFPHNESLLVDGGQPDEGSTIVSYLRSVGISHLNGVVATHPDADHIGGLIDVLQSMPVDKVYDLGLAKSTTTYEKLLRIIMDKNISYATPRAGDTINLDPDTAVLVLNPSLPLFPMATDANDNSIVIKITYQHVSYLLTGDAESAAEARMVSLFNSSAYVLKVGHHGSKYSSSATFLKAVKPHIAVISVGAGNRFGHPAPETLARLAAVGATVYRTDHHGTIVVTTNGQTLDVGTAR